MANLRNIQFLRNAQVYASLAAAKDALTTQAANKLDGSPLIGRYLAGEEERSILGLVHVSGSTTGVTFFMNEKEIDNVLAGLDYSGITTSDAAVVTNVTEADGKIAATSENVGNLKLTDYTKGSNSGAVAATDSINAAVAKLENQIDAEKDARAAAIDALDASSVADDNKVVTDVTQSSGQITATASNITGVKLAGYQEAAATGDVATTDTLGEALGKLQKTIHEMDKAAAAEDGKVVTTVSEDDGVVSETKANVKDLQLGGYAKTSDTGAISGTDTINVALSKIENQIGKNTVTAKDKSIVVETTGSTTEVGVNIRSGERVLKLDTDATSGGVYTDLNVVKITSDLPAEIKERYELRDSSNVKIGESIDIAKDSHIVSITYISDPADPKYQNLEYKYIDVSGNTQTEYVDVSSLVIEAEFASGVTVTNHVAHGVVDPTSENFLTVGANGFKVSGVADAISAAVNALDADVSGNSTHVTVNVVEENGVITDVNVVESNIANADDLATLSGKTITVLTSANNSISISDGTIAEDGTMSFDLVTDASKISGLTAVADVAGEISGVSTTDSVQTAVENLYASLEAEIAARKAAISSTTVVGSNAIDVTPSSTGDTISLILDDSTVGTGSEKTGNYNALSITSDGLFLSTNWDCGTFNEA